jgi:hypothetical protein
MRRYHPRHHSNHLSIGCLLLVLLLAGPLGFAATIINVVNPAEALGIIASANLYIGTPVLLVAALWWARHSLRSNRQRVGPYPLPHRVVVREQPTPQTTKLLAPPHITPAPAPAPVSRATKHPRPTSADRVPQFSARPTLPKLPAEPAKPRGPTRTPVYWGRTVIGWEDEQGNVHFDRKGA